MTRTDYHTLFDRTSSQYVQFRPGYPPSLYEFIVGAVAERQLVWDCGTGSGQAAVSLAEYFDQVVATDASLTQLQHAPKHPKIRFVAAPAEECPLATGSCDLVTAANAVHWFHIDKFFAEAQRVLKPGGVVAVWCYTGVKCEDSKLDEDFEKLKMAVHPYWPEPIKLVFDNYLTLPFPFEDIEQPEPFSLVVEWNIAQLIGYCSTWSATENYIKAQGVDPIQTWFEGIVDKYPDTEKRYRIIFPLRMRIGRNAPKSV